MSHGSMDVLENGRSVCHELPYEGQTCG
jgi:hypothetical protein